MVGLPLTLNITVFFLFFSALFVYNLFQILGSNSKKLLLSKSIIFISFCGLIVSLYFLNKDLLPFFIVTAILSFFYATPFFTLGKNDFNLRKYWFLKSIIVGLVWTISTSIVPLFENGITIETITLMSLEKFLFIVGITIPYDIKDIKEDKEQQGMKTLVMKFGVKQAVFFSNFILLTGMFLGIYLNQGLLMPIFLAYMLAFILNLKLDENKNDYWYTFLIDATIILYFIFVWIYSN